MNAARRGSVLLATLAVAGTLAVSLTATGGQQPAPPAAPPAPAAPPPDQPDRSQVFRAGVEIVSLNVTVVNGQNNYVTDLREDEFAIFEDGAKQDLAFFNRTTLPIAMSLLIDTSASMEQRMAIAQEAAIGFVQKMRPEDLTQVVDFDSRVEIAQDFTGDTGLLEKAIRATAAGGSTSLHNALYISLKELAKVRAKSAADVRRQAIVVLSDGEDTSSLVSYEEVLELAKRSETSIYTIGLQPRETSAVKGFREAEFVLRQLGQETGGRAFFPSRAEELKGIYAQIADELSSQYSVGYAPKNARRDGAWRRVVVQVSRPNLVVRSKRGYYAPTSH